MRQLLVAILLCMFSCSAASAQDALTYTVRSGDTLHHIARKYGLTVEGLMRINGLGSSLIRIDQVLQLPSKSPTRGPEVLPAEGLRSSLALARVALREPDISTAGSGEPGSPAVETLEPDVFALKPGEPDSSALESDEPYPSTSESGEPYTSTSESEDLDTSALGSPAASAADTSLQPVNDEVPFDLSPTFERPPQNDAHIPDELASTVDTTTYVVGAGETFYSIARDLKTRAYVLHVLNQDIRGPLEPGMPLVVPASAGSDPASGYDVYEVGTVDVLKEDERGRAMAGGGLYNPSDFVVAHPNLPFGSILIVEYPDTGRAAFARVADRIPNDGPHIMHVSSALASEIEIDSGVHVRIRLIE